MFLSQWSLGVSIVGIVTGLGVGQSGICILLGARNMFLSAKRTELFWGQPSWHLGGFPGVTLASHLNVTSRKNGWSYTSAPTRLHVVGHDKFTLPCILLFFIVLL